MRVNELEQMDNRNKNQEKELKRKSKELEQLRANVPAQRGTLKLLLAEKARLGMARSVRDGIPLLGTPFVSLSAPSLATGHEPAKLVECDFGLTRLIVPEERARRQSVIWNLANDTKTLRFTEADLQFYVQYVLIDVISELSLGKSLSIHREVTTFGIRPDAWVITANGVPVGVVEVKNPGNCAVSDQRVVVELYDYMKRLSGSTERKRLSAF
jgi:hypothetical protein